MTTQAILDLLEAEERSIDGIYITPPDVHCDSEGDSGDEDGGGLVDNLSGRQLQAEATILTNNEEQDIDIDIPDRPRPAKRMKSQKDSISYKWDSTKNFTPAFIQKIYEVQQPSINLSGKTPLQKFNYFFDETLLDLITSESIKYAAQKNVSFSVTASEIRAVLGILLLSGYRPVPARRMYWSSDEDVRSDFVADAISRDRFEQILSFLHFTDNMKLDKNEKLAKLRLLIK